MHSDFLHKRHSSLTDRSKGPIPSQMINQEKTCCTLQRAVGRRADIYGAFYLFKTSEDRLIVKASYVAVAFLSLYILKCFDTCFLAGKFAVVFFFPLLSSQLYSSKGQCTNGNSVSCFSICSCKRSHSFSQSGDLFADHCDSSPRCERIGRVSSPRGEMMVPYSQ